MRGNGGCLCGAVRYRVTGPPGATSLCHCKSCRRATGGPSLAWAIFDEDKVEIVAGALAVYASSPGVERGFCGRCGTSLTYARANRPGLFDVTTASLDDPEAFPPDKEIWVEERLSWEAANSAFAAIRAIQHGGGRAIAPAACPEPARGFAETMICATSS